MNVLKVSSVMALMVLGSSVYGMADKGLSKELIRHAQPIAQPMFPATPRCPGAGVSPVRIVTPDQSPAASVGSTPQSTPERDIESGEVVAKKGCLGALKSRVGGWFKPCTDLAKRCWSTRGGKDAAKLSFLSALNLGMWVYTTYANNPSVANIFGFTVVGTGSAAITSDYDWIYKMIADLLVLGGYAGLKFGADITINPVLCAGLGYAVSITLGDYGIVGGLINTEYAKYYQSLPEDIQKIEAERFRAEGRRIKAIMKRRKQDHMAEMELLTPAQH